MSKYIWLFDNGHAGVIHGVYQTKGKRSPKVPPGVYEGEFNRAIVERLCEMCVHAHINHCNLVPELIHVTLKERARRANEIFHSAPRIYISIHANAAGMGKTWHPANGIATFYYSKTGMALAKVLQHKLIEYTDRRDRGIKKAQFTVLRKTSMPAVLSENGFMTNKEEAKLLASEDFRDKIAAAHFAFIKEIENG